MILLICLGTVFCTVLICSFVEWFVHGPLMHGLPESSYLRRAHEEHHDYFGIRAYKNNYHGSHVHLPAWAAISTAGTMSLIGYSISLLTNHWEIALCVAVPATLYYYLYQYVHTCMHIPVRDDQWFSKWFISTRVFKFLDQWHHVHHVRDEEFHELRNICLLLPFADLVLRTVFRPKRQNREVA